MVTLTTTQTTQAPVVTKGDVLTTFNYFQDPTPTEKDCLYGTATFWRKQYAQRKSIVHDIRGHEDDFKLDVHGFEFHRHRSAVSDWKDDEQIKQIYYPEVDALLKKRTGASRIVFIVHINRKHSPSDLTARIANIPDTSQELLGMVPPLQHVHVDQSYDGINNMISYCVPPEDADRLKKVRHAIINVWRPLSTIRRDPLALSDGRSIPEEDLVDVTTNLTEGRSNGTFGVLPPDVDEKTGCQEKHRWYWCSEMTPEELYVFKITDSKVDGRMRRTPHSAFHLAGTEGEETRQSLEMRCLVFWEDEPAE